MSKLPETITLDAGYIKPKEQQLYEAMLDANIQPPDFIEFDGLIHRFSTNGKSGDKSGWYVAYDGQIPAASFGNWRDSSVITWCGNIGRNLTMIENMAYKAQIADAKAKRDAEFAAKRETAIETAQSILIKSAHADESHPYLIKKGIQPHIAMVGGDGRLIIPVYSDGQHNLSSLQFIDSSGSKQFLTGGQIAGCWCEIGDVLSSHNIFIAEGYATAATIYEKTGKPCVVAFNAGNMPAVAKSIRAKVGITASITICADLDDNGIGEIKAKEAAQTIGAKVVISPTSSDFNDAVKAGVDIVQLLLPQPTQSDWLIHASELVKQRESVRWLIKNWIPRNSLIMIHGPSGSGKSLVTLDMVARIASDSDTWNDHKVRHGSVVYLAGEGYIGMTARLLAWQEANSTDAVNMWISKHGCDLNAPEGYLLARDSILSTGEKPVLIVVDTLHRFMAGDENSAQDAKSLIDACGGLQREFGCSVLLVHHTGVAEGAQSRARGSSAWKGALESEISIVPQNDTTPMEIINIKSKDSALAQTKYMRIHAHQFTNGWVDEDGEAVKGAIILPSEKVEKDSKQVGNDKKAFDKAAKFAKCFTENGKKIVVDSDWLDSIRDENGKISASSKAMKSQTKKRLIEAGLIEELNGGYVANYEQILF